MRLNGQWYGGNGHVCGDGQVLVIRSPPGILAVIIDQGAHTASFRRHSQRGPHHKKTFENRFVLFKAEVLL